MPPATIGDLASIFSRVVSLALTGAGLAAFIMLLVGGFQLLTASGDKEATTKAQKTLTFAIFGLVVTLSAWIILNFLGNFLGLDFSVFNICLPGFSGSNCS